MKLIRFFFSLQFWISLILALAIIAGLVFGTIKWLDFYTNHGKSVSIPNLSKMDVKTAIKALENADLKYEIDSFKYDPAFKPHQIMEFYPAAGEKVKTGRRIFIKSNPKTWPPVALPNIINRSKVLAFTQLKIAGLQVGDTLFEPNIAKDAVLRVIYNGKLITTGTLLPRFAKVNLVLGLGYAHDVRVPSYLGMTYAEAKGLITSNYFTVGTLNFQGSIKDSMNARIYYQNPLPNDIYDQGLPITLWLTNQPVDSMKFYTKELDKVYRHDLITDSIRATQPQNINYNGLSEETRAQLKESPNTPPVQQPADRPRPRSKPTTGSGQKVGESGPPEGMNVE